jgi:hypothetical protein
MMNPPLGENMMHNAGCWSAELNRRFAREFEEKQ